MNQKSKEITANDPLTYTHLIKQNVNYFKIKF